MGQRLVKRRIKQVWRPRLTPGVCSLLCLLSADLLNGVNQRRLIRRTNAEWTDWLSVCRLLIEPSLWAFSPDFIGKFMGLKAQQNQAVAQFSGVVHQGR